MSSRIAILVGVLALAVLGVLLWWDGGDAPSVGTSEVRERGSAAEGVEGADALEAAVAAAGAEAAIEERAELVPEAGEERVVELRVRVVRDGDGSPVPGAAVYLVDARIYRDPEKGALLSGLREVGEVVEDLVRPAQTGHDGVVIVRAVGAWVSLFAGIEGMWGLRQFDLREVASSPVEVELRLEDDFGVSVLVVGEGGAPVAGVPVAYRATSRWPRARAVMTRESGADGLVRFRHLGALSRWETSGLPDVGHYVSLELPLAERIYAEFDPEALPAEPIRLVLPATGAVVVKARDLEGKPAEDGLWVMLQERMPGEIRERYGSPPGTMERQSWLGLMNQRLAGGEARFDRVGLGLRLEIGTWFEQGGDLDHVEADGPREPGEIVEVELRQSRATPAVTARLLDADGAPWKGEGSFDGWFLRIGEDGRRVRKTRLVVRPDETGLFRAPIANLPAATPLYGRFVFTSSPSGSRGSMRLWVSDEIRQLPAGALDLGDLRLESGPLAAGVVVDSAGLPLETCHVLAQVVRPRSGAPAPDPTPYSRVLASLIGDIYLWTREDGRFEFWFPRSLLSEGEFAVQPPRDRPRLRQARFPFVAGQEDLRLVMGEGTGIMGRILCDPPFQGHLRVEVRTPQRSAAGELQGIAISRVNQGVDGAFDRFTRAGEHDLVVRDQTSGQPLHRLERIQVTEGRMTDVGTIDLRGRLWQRTVTARSATGAAISQLAIADPGAVDPHPMEWRENPLQLIVTEPVLSVHLAAPGHRQTPVLLDREEVEVLMPAGLPVRVRVGGLEAAPAGMELRLSFGPPTDSPLGEITLVAELVSLDDPVVDFSLPAPGTWRVGINLIRPTGERSYQAFGLGGAAIEVAEAIGLQLFTIAADEDAVAKHFGDRP